MDDFVDAQKILASKYSFKMRPGGRLITVVFLDQQSRVITRDNTGEEYYPKMVPTTDWDARNVSVRELIQKDYPKIRLSSPHTRWVGTFDLALNHADPTMFDINSAKSHINDPLSMVAWDVTEKRPGAALQDAQRREREHLAFIPAAWVNQYPYFLFVFPA